jgi:hypothetical protein
VGGAGFKDRIRTDVFQDPKGYSGNSNHLAEQEQVFLGK